MIEHTLLEYDASTQYALVATSPLAVQRFVECYKYDINTREWSQGHYFSTLEEAIVSYNRDTNGIGIYIEDNDVFCDIKWCREDVMSFLENHFGPEWATARNVDLAIKAMGKCLKDRSIEEGWEIMQCLVYEDDLEAPEKKEA